MSTYSVICPHCAAALNSSQPIPTGRQVRCSKCQNVFVSGNQQVAPPARQPAAPPFDQAPSAPLPPAIVVPPRQYRRGSKKGLIIGLSVGGGVFALLVIGLILFFVLRNPLAGEIVGKWQNVDRQSEIIEMTSDGRFRVWRPNSTKPRVTGTYDVSGDRFTVTISDRGRTMIESFRIEIRNQRLIMYREREEDHKNNRVDSQEYMRVGT